MPHQKVIFAQIVGFVRVVGWISLRCYVDLSKLIHGFVIGSCYRTTKELHALDPLCLWQCLSC